MLISPYLVGGFWKLPTIIERGLVGWRLMTCPVIPGERTKWSLLCARLWGVGREEVTEPNLRVF